MLIDDLQTLYKRELNKLKTEIASFQSEAQLWITAKEIANPAGNLCLHLLGNLNTYIGAGLAGTGYVRQRDLEFSQKNIPKQQLIQQIEATILVVEKGLAAIPEESLPGDFPVQIWDKPTGMIYALIHLLTHLGYHLGQVNYHRRLTSSHE